MLDAALKMLHDLIERAADLTHVSCDIGHAALMVIELFKRDHRQINVVLFKAEDTCRIVHEDIGIQHIKALFPVVRNIFVSAMRNGRAGFLLGRGGFFAHLRFNFPDCFFCGDGFQQRRFLFRQFSRFIFSGTANRLFILLCWALERQRGGDIRQSACFAGRHFW